MANATALPLAAMCLFALSCAPTSPGTVAPQRAESIVAPEVVAAIDSIARAAVSEGAVAGISIGVSSAGRQVYRGGHGLERLETSVPVSDSTVVRIGSIAKQMTAAAILRLEEQGQLSLTDPVSRHVADAPPHWEAATIRHLLNHTSGIPSYTDLPEFGQLATDYLPAQERIRMVRDLPLSFEPETRRAYSNTGYLLLGQIIEHLSGRSYGEYVQLEFVGPLVLRETGACSEADPRLAQGYRRGSWSRAPSDL